jgi:hypothetical protein
MQPLAPRDGWSKDLTFWPIDMYILLCLSATDGLTDLIGVNLRRKIRCHKGNQKILPSSHWHLSWGPTGHDPDFFLLIILFAIDEQRGWIIVGMLFFHLHLRDYFSLICSLWMNRQPVPNWTSQLEFRLETRETALLSTTIVSSL